MERGRGAGLRENEGADFRWAGLASETERVGGHTVHECKAEKCPGPGGDWGGAGKKKKEREFLQVPVNSDPKSEVNILGSDIISKERTLKTRQDYTSVKLLKRKKWR